MPEFEGTSNKSNVQEALDKAVQGAVNTVSHPDWMISYSLKKISGRRSGIAGLNELTVVIEAELH